jgi:hypothetical protein
LSDLRSVTSTGSGPGEISGQPAVAFVLTFNNGSASTVSLTDVTVDFKDSADNPGTPDDGTPAQPVAASVAAHSTQSGTYVFRVPTDTRSKVTISVHLNTSVPDVALTGAVS